MGVTSLIKVSFSASLSFHPSVWRFRGGTSTVSRFRGEISNQANTKCKHRNEGVRRPICDMSLLIFHLVLSAFTFEGVDVRKAARVLEWNLERYPNGA
jgi:hypothetical protein